MGAFDFIGDAFNQAARGRAARAQQDAINTYGDLSPEIHPSQVTNDAFDEQDNTAKNAQTEAYQRLAGIGAQGGMDPGSTAALQQAQMSNAQQAKSSTDAALERAKAEGRLNSGRALSAQIQAGQGAANANAMAGTQAAADARTRAMQALASSGQLAGNQQGQNNQQAAAQNQLRQFNQQMGQQAQQLSFQNAATRAGGIAQGDQALAGANLQRAQEARESAGAIGDAVVKGATAAATGGLSAVGGFGGGAAQGMMGGQDAAASNAVHNVYAGGGMVDGHAPVAGDSQKNDVVPAKLSPGEIVIPRSVVGKGPDAIREFALKLLRGEG